MKNLLLVLALVVGLVVVLPLAAGLIFLLQFGLGYLVGLGVFLVFGDIINWVAGHWHIHLSGHVFAGLFGLRTLLVSAPKFAKKEKE